MEDEGGNGQQLLGAAKNLAGAVSNMLTTAQPANTEVHILTTKGDEEMSRVFQVSALCRLTLCP